jgi:ssDNA-binding Zn-finger/Zn-ribbon topoisomerase 1
MRKMRKIPLFNRSLFYRFLVLILIGASITSFPSTKAFSAGSVIPTISIKSPANNDILEPGNVVISGTYTDNVSKSDLRFSAEGSVTSDSISKPTEWNIDDSGAWTYTTTLPEGTHTVTIKVEETTTPIDPTMVDTATVTFKSGFRPYVIGTGIILPDGTERNGEDLTSIPVNSKIKITVADDNPMNNLKNKILTDSYNPVKIPLASGTVTGTTAINDLGLKNGKYTYEIIFTPNSDELLLNKSYSVFLDQGLVDDLDIPIYPKSFKFTTKNNPKWDDSNNPHGHVQLNSNICATCHSTHDSKNSPSLIGGSYQVTFNDGLTKDQPVDDPSQNYCMACHDGTTNAPFDNGSSGFKHNNPVDDSTTETKALKQPDSCTSCHNPHLEWSEGNPNLLVDHYVYTHSQGDLNKKGLATRVIDSLDIKCEKCHEGNIVNSNSIFDKSTYPDGNYSILSYSKSTTAVGNLSAKIIDANIGKTPDLAIKTMSDYSLCFRCHNPEKTEQSDIETYYANSNNLINSGHNFTLPANSTTQKDGSKLDGPIPCAECHETHGSSNFYNLRGVFGNSIGSVDKYSTSGPGWGDDNERRFCLSCHSNGTEIYGRKATLKVTDTNGIAISGHQASDTKGCSFCHGGSFIKTAHAPQPGVDPTK